MKIKIPAWLKKILDDSGMEQGKYTFEEGMVELNKLPEGFVGIAETDGGGLAVSKIGDDVVYKLENGKVEVFATNEQEFRLGIRRDESWEELSENMPATKPFWLGIILKTKNEDGAVMTLGFKGSSKDSVTVIQGEMRAEEMLSDALTRELSEVLGIKDYQIMDVLDDGGEFEVEGEMVPLFTIVVSVDKFNPETLGDSRIDWIRMEQKKVVN